MAYDVLDEAYERFRRTGPEWGEDQLTNHGPMAVEVLVRRGTRRRGRQGWVDAYVRRLDDMPAAAIRSPPRAGATRSATAGASATGRDFFERQVAEAPWRDVLVTWWPRLLPGVVAGATHGVIRAGHAVRTLRSGGDESPRRSPNWRTARVLGGARPRRARRGRAAGALRGGRARSTRSRASPSSAGNVANRFGQLTGTPGLAGVARGAAGAGRPARRRGGPRRRGRGRHRAATCATGHASPVLLVHTATAPNAVLHTLPALPATLWAPSLSAVWAATAAITSASGPSRRGRAADVAAGRRRPGRAARPRRRPRGRARHQVHRHRRGRPRAHRRPAQR